MAASWRDGVPQDVQDDLDRLFGTVEPFALQTVARFRRLLPFGAVLETSGKVRPVGSVPKGAAPLALAIRTGLVDGMRKERGSLRAVVLVEDVAVDEVGSDAIRFTLEHRDGPTIAVFALYSVGRWPGRTVTFGERAVGEGESLVWEES